MGKQVPVRRLEVIARSGELCFLQRTNQSYGSTGVRFTADHFLVFSASAQRQAWSAVFRWPRSVQLRVEGRPGSMWLFPCDTDRKFVPLDAGEGGPAAAAWPR